MDNHNMFSSVPLLYLDWGVIISIADGHLPVLQTSLKKAINKHVILLPFSATHVQEADHINDGILVPNELFEDRLKFLSELTQDTYLYNAGDSYSPSIRRQHPKEVKQTLDEVPFAKGTMQSFINFVSLETMKQIRKGLKLNPNDLNNIKPPDVIGQLDRAIAKKLSGQSPQLSPNFGIKQLLEMTIKFYPNSENLGIGSKMAAVFSSLNSLGFWPDNPKKTTTIAAFFDSMHASNASHCHYFVTEDKALRQKTIAVYEFFNIKTEVLGVGEILAILNEENLRDQAQQFTNNR